MTTAYLIDGTFELFRCFHGAPRSAGRSGAEVGACRALLATLVALLVHERVTHAAVAFDSVIAPAKQPGPPTAEALIGAQQPLAAQVVRALGLPVWPAGRYQADDVLASAASRLARDPAIDRVVICSNDNDLAQCVRGDRVVLLDRIRKVVTDEVAVVERFGVSPGQIPDLLALIGDRSDGVAGVPGWGPRSAAAALQRWGSLERIPLDPATWDVPIRGAARLAAALAARRDEALLARELSIRVDDLAIPATADRIAWNGADRIAVAALVEELGDDSQIGRIPAWRTL